MDDISNQDVLHTLNQQARLFQKSMNQSLNEHGLFASQWSILFCLHEFGSMTQTDISRYLHVEAPTVTRTLLKMEESGWIIRTQGSDKRARLIALTPTAKEKYSAVHQSVQELEQHLLGDFTEEDKQLFYQLLQKLKR